MTAQVSTDGHLTTCARCGREYRPLRRGCCNRCDWHRRSLIGYQCSYVDAEPVRVHVKALQAAGVGLRRISQLAGVDRKILQWMMTGRPERKAPPSARIAAVNAEKILAVALPEAQVHRVCARGALVDAADTTRRLQGLVAFGYTRGYLAGQLGVTPANATRLFRDGDRRVTAGLASRVEDLFHHLQATPGPSARARADGAARGWIAPAQVSTVGHLDDEQAKTQHRRDAQHRRWASELEQRRLAKAASAQTDRLLDALRVALFGDQEGDWRERAVCAQVDPDRWFPEKGGSTKEAKKLCLTCPVRDECLEFALENEERFGIWGAKSERERRAILRRRELAAQESA